MLMKMTVSGAMLVASVALAYAQSDDAPRYFSPFDAGAAPNLSIPKTIPSFERARLDAQDQGRLTETPVPSSNAPASSSPPSQTTQEEPQQAGSSPGAVTPAERSDYVAGMVLSGVATTYGGHSLVVDGHAIRLNGIETPRDGHICRTSARTAWDCGSRVSARLKAIADGQTVKCIVNSPAGAGASATCSTRQIADLGLFLVREGLAVPNVSGSSAYGSDASTAAASGKGLWTGPFDRIVP